MGSGRASCGNLTRKGSGRSSADSISRIVANTRLSAMTSTRFGWRIYS
jgi:hypothetical protein